MTSTLAHTRLEALGLEADELIAGVGELEIELGGPGRTIREFSPAFTHHILATRRRGGAMLTARLPHHKSLEPLPEAVSEMTPRLTVLFADRVVGQGGRALDVPYTKLESHDVPGRLVFEAMRQGSRFEIGQEAAFFSPVFEDVLSEVRRGCRLLGLPMPGIHDDLLSPAITGLMKEALDNGRLHARESVVNGRLLSGYQFVSIRRLQSDALATGETINKGIAGWLQGISALAAARQSPPLDLLEVTIADSGEGIAATMEESLEIYTKPHLFEMRSIGRALLPGVTRPSNRPYVAPSTKKGEGFAEILRLLTVVRGCAMVWSGRTRMAWSSIDEHGARKAALPVDELSLLSDEWHPTETPRVAGTTISVMVPFDPDQPGLVDTLLDP